jgi:hypothetical protein
MTCPRWCQSNHKTSGEHASREIHRQGMIYELIQFDGEETVYLSILEDRDVGDRVMVPLEAVPGIPDRATELQNA